MNTKNQKGFAEWLIIAGGVVLLGIGALVGRLLNNQTSKNQESGATVTPSEIITPVVTSTAPTKGLISGYLIYPSEHIPEEMGVCAQKIDNQSLIICTPQIKDKKYQNGVGYEMPLDPGNYYVYSFLDETKAYYTEFVLCGLKAECKSHTKIPVVVTAGSVQDNILPHDWYDFSDTPAPTNTVTPSLTVAPTVKPTSKIVPIVSIKLEKDMIRLLPTSTPTPIPTLKIINPAEIEIPKIEFGF